MKKQAILDIVLKIIGILLLKDGLISALSAVSSLSLYFQDQGNYPYSIMALLQSTVLWIFIYCVIGFLLLKHSKVIAAKLIKDDGDLDIELPDDWERRVFSIALKVVGVICLIHGIAAISPHLWDWSRYESKYKFITFSMPTFATAITNVVIGIYLLRGGEFLVRTAFQKKKKKRKMNTDEEWECSECGTTISADAVVCPKCGADVSEIEEEDTNSDETILT